jgi:hypothetical protein
LQKNSFRRTLTLILLLTCLLAGVVHLFILCFQKGDIYPAYSSLRSDPLGTRAFYESLENLNEIAVRRNYHLPSSLKFEPQTTFLYLGANAADNELMPKNLSNVFQRLTQSGGRLVLTFLPIIKENGEKPCVSEKDNNEGKIHPKTEHGDSTQKPTGEKKTVTSGEPDCAEADNPALEKDASENPFVSIKETWGIGFNYNENLPVKEKKYSALDAVSLRPDLPAAVSWHTNLYFDLLDATWQTIYVVQGNPVIVERPMGEGTLVLCADSFFISNEALRSERHPQLLIWLLGRPRNIIFDETHFGIFKNPGVAGLLRHYRFQWFFVSLFLLALLFVWKNAVYFIPPRQDDIPGGADIVSEKDYTSGLIALLRRNIADSNILQVCGQQWKQTFKKDQRIPTDAVAHIEHILKSDSPSSKKKSDPVAGYRKISSALKLLGIYSRGIGYE